MRQHHQSKALKYSKIREVVGSRTMLRVPENNILQQQLPALKVHSSLKCENGHLSLAVASIIRISCRKLGCDSATARLISCHKIGKSLYEIDGETQFEPDSSYPAFSNEYLDQIFSEITTEQERDTRSSNFIDRIVSSIDSIFPQDSWTPETIKVLLHRRS